MVASGCDEHKAVRREPVARGGAREGTILGKRGGLEGLASVESGLVAFVAGFTAVPTVFLGPPHRW